MKQFMKTVVVFGMVVMFGAAVGAQRSSPPAQGGRTGTPPAGARPGGEGRTGGARPGGEGRTGGNGREGKPAKPGTKPTTPPDKKPAKPCKPTPTKPCK